MRAFLIALVLAALAAGGYYFYQQQQPAPAAPAETSTLPQTDGREALAIFHKTQLGRDDEAFWMVGVTALLAFGAVWLTERLTPRRAGGLR